MPRPRKHGEIVPHPSARFRDRVRLHKGVSGPADLGWRASYKLADGTWTPKPLSLGTKDFGVACDLAGDRLAVLDVTGQVPKAHKPRAAAKSVEHSVAEYGRLAIQGLEARAETAVKIHPGKAAKFRGLIRYIREPLTRDLGNLDIRKLDEAALYQPP